MAGDHISEQAFYMKGSIDKSLRNTKVKGLIELGIMNQELRKITTFTDRCLARRPQVCFGNI